MHGGSWDLGSTYCWASKPTLLGFSASIRPPTVGFRKLEYGPGTMQAGFPSSQAVGVGGQSYSNFLASTVTVPIQVAPIRGRIVKRRDMKLVSPRSLYFRAYP